MNVLYVKKGKISKGSSRRILMELLYDYVAREGLYNGPYSKFVNLSKIHVDDNGRPFLETGIPNLPADFSIDFSISHSGDYWACLISRNRCGLDIQEIKNVNASKIANRFFSESEIKYIEKGGSDRFFDIWVMREAFGKMTGKGFYCDPPEFVDGRGKLKSAVIYVGQGTKHQEKYHLVLSNIDSEIDSESNTGVIDSKTSSNNKTKYKCALCIMDPEYVISEI